jgi:RNA 3'-terminal phosphate cyclase (ATP)
VRLPAVLYPLPSPAVSCRLLPSPATSLTANGLGLKAQHLAAVNFLAKATEADVEGLQLGSKSLVFTPRLPPTSLTERKVEITPPSPASSSLLIFQAVFPFLLYAANAESNPIELIIRGGTHTEKSLTFDFQDQVLLPILTQRFGIRVGRTLTRRGWTIGPTNRGHITFTINPIKPGEALSARDQDTRFSDAKDYEVSHIDATVIVPPSLHREFEETLRRDLGDLFPGVPMHTKKLEDSEHESRVYILLVAISESGLRWGRDILYALPKNKKAKSKKVVSPVDDAVRKVTKGLFEEVRNRSQLDSHAQDQVVVFQALAKGLTSFPRRQEPVDEVRDLLRGLNFDEPSQMRKERTTDGPFGEGTLHTRTVRWVCAEMLPEVVFYNKGLAVEGAGIVFEG